MVCPTGAEGCKDKAGKAIGGGAVQSYTSALDSYPGGTQGTVVQTYESANVPVWIVADVEGNEGDEIWGFDGTEGYGEEGEGEEGQDDIYITSEVMTLADLVFLHIAGAAGRYSSADEIARILVDETKVKEQQELYEMVVATGDRELAEAVAETIRNYTPFCRKLDDLLRISKRRSNAGLEAIRILGDVVLARQFRALSSNGWATEQLDEIVKRLVRSGKSRNDGIRLNSRWALYEICRSGKAYLSAKSTQRLLALLGDDLRQWNVTDLDTFSREIFELTVDTLASLFDPPPTEDDPRYRPSKKFVEDYIHLVLGWTWDLVELEGRLKQGEYIPDASSLDAVHAMLDNLKEVLIPLTIFYGTASGAGANGGIIAEVKTLLQADKEGLRRLAESGLLADEGNGRSRIEEAEQNPRIRFAACLDYIRHTRPSSYEEWGVYFRNFGHLLQNDLFPEAEEEIGEEGLRKALKVAFRVTDIVTDATEPALQDDKVLAQTGAIEFLRSFIDALRQGKSKYAAAIWGEWQRGEWNYIEKERVRESGGGYRIREYEKHAPPIDAMIDKLLFAQGMDAFWREETQKLIRSLLALDDDLLDQRQRQAILDTLAMKGERGRAWLEELPKSLWYQSFWPDEGLNGDTVRLAIENLPLLKDERYAEERKALLKTVLAQSSPSSAQGNATDEATMAISPVYVYDGLLNAWEGLEDEERGMVIEAVLDLVEERLKYTATAKTKSSTTPALTFLGRLLASGKLDTQSRKRIEKAIETPERWLFHRFVSADTDEALSPSPQAPQATSQASLAIIRILAHEASEVLWDADANSIRALAKDTVQIIDTLAAIVKSTSVTRAEREEAMQGMFQVIRASADETDKVMFIAEPTIKHLVQLFSQGGNSPLKHLPKDEYESYRIKVIETLQRYAIDEPLRGITSAAVSTQVVNPTMRAKTLQALRSILIS